MCIYTYIFFIVEDYHDDNDLQLTAEDMESLRSQLPDLALTISSPDLNSITQFFLSKSLTSGDENNKEKDSASMRVDVATKEQERARAPMLFDRYPSTEFCQSFFSPA